MVLIWVSKDVEDEDKPDERRMGGIGAEEGVEGARSTLQLLFHFEGSGDPAN